MVKLPLNQLTFTKLLGMHFATSRWVAHSVPLPTLIVKSSNISPVPPTSEIEPVMVIGPKVPSDLTATLVELASMETCKLAQTNAANS